MHYDEEKNVGKLKKNIYINKFVWICYIPQSSVITNINGFNLSQSTRQ